MRQDCIYASSVKRFCGTAKKQSLLCTDDKKVTDRKKRNGVSPYNEGDINGGGLTCYLHMPFRNQ